MDSPIGPADWARRAWRGELGAVLAVLMIRARNKPDRWQYVTLWNVGGRPALTAGS